MWNCGNIVRRIGVKHYWSVVLPLALVLLGSSLADGAEKNFSVNVDPGLTQSNNVGCGFSLVEDMDNTLEINLSSNIGRIVNSWLVAYAPGQSWQKVDGSPTHWRLSGVSPAESFYCIIKVQIVPPGHGNKTGSPIIRYMSVSDVDLDADTDNNSVSIHRPLSGSASEDLKEYPVTTSDNTIGLIVPVNDDNDVSWTERDYMKSLDYDQDDDVLAMTLKINAKKAGTFNITSGLYCYDSSGKEIGDAGFSKTVSAGSFSKALRVESKSGQASGGTGTVEAWFVPNTPRGGAYSRDRIRYLLAGVDIDVDSDNNGSIEGTNGQSSGEDFYENHPVDQLSSHAEYKYGMLVSVNDDDDDNNGKPDNGWNGTSWEGDDASTIQGADDQADMKLAIMRKLNISTSQAEAIDAMFPKVYISKISGDGGVRIFTKETDSANAKLVLEAVGNESFSTKAGDDELWSLLSGSNDLELLVEGLKPGEVVLEVEIVVNGNCIIHCDTVKITVIQASLMLYKRDGTTMVTKKSDPGAYVAINNDDDDADGGGTEMDKDDTNGITGEDDLIKAEFKFDSSFDSLQEGIVTIERTNGKIKLWKQATKGTDQELAFTNNKREYDLSNATQRQAFTDEVKNKICFVEGVEASTTIHDSGLTLTFVKNATAIISDETKMTVVDVALQIYKRDGTTLIGLDKKASPGSFILYNNDDDDADGTMDSDDDATTGEDDLAKARPTFGALFNDLQKGRVALQRANDKIKVWKAMTKGADSELEFTSNKRIYDLATSEGRTAFQNEIRNKDVFVEGYAVSGDVRDAGLILTYDDGDATPIGVSVHNVAITVIVIDLKEISFSGDKYHEIKKDDNSIDYDAPHWKDSSSPRDKDADDEDDRKYPVAFTRNTFMKISAKIEIGPAAAFPDGPKLKADHSGNYDFAADGTKSGTEVTITDIECANKLEDKVAYVNPLELEWSMSVDGGTEWFAFGKTQNVLYVTLGDPVTGTVCFETLFDISCRNAANETTQADLASKTYSEFTDRIVRRKLDNKQMTYWLNDQMGATTVGPTPTGDPGILQRADGNGNCQAWSGLFRDALRVHGLDAHRVRLFPLGTSDDTGILVKNWHFEASPCLGNVITTGANGKANTTAAGDDVQVIPLNQGLPNATAITAGKNLSSIPAGDDVANATNDAITTGADGICDTVKGGKDSQVIPVGNGKPHQTCITAGVNLASTPAGDDQEAGNTITTGTDGICNTAKGGNDIQTISVGNGSPNEVAITAGVDVTLNSATAGDDQVVGNAITTGPDGVCNTVVAGDDVQEIPAGQGKPNIVCVTAGTNLKSTTGGDDAIVGNTITTGANGKCESTIVGNDTQVISVGNGKSNETAINAAIKIVSTVGGDDVEMNEVITTGPDGICNSTTAGNDVQVIANGNGKPNAIAVNAGANGTLNTAAAGDDVVQAVGARPTPDPAPNHPYTAFINLWARIGVDAWPTTGVTGQGNAYPPPSFNGHWITKWKDGTTFKYFDPSYGAAVVSNTDEDDAIEAYENGALAGFSGPGYGVGGINYTPVRKNVTTAGTGPEVEEFNAD